MHCTQALGEDDMDSIADDIQVYHLAIRSYNLIIAYLYIYI